ncbi:MAG: hypothetical protein JJT95_11220 [Pararhodobacter sp.]|nr:hypothetical protein [Pararhodobacter sp.]
MRLKLLPAICTALGLGLVLAACEPVDEHGLRAVRHFDHEGSTYGYHLHVQPRASVGRDGEVEMDMWGGTRLITIYTRDGEMITESDRDAAIGAARALCRRDGALYFDPNARGSFLNRGGLYFPTACRGW